MYISTCRVHDEHNFGMLFRVDYVILDGKRFAFYDPESAEWSRIGIIN
jgi:hypothetical protein